jgi:DNA primase
VPQGDAVREVKDRLDIVEVISGYVRLQRAGRDHKGVCPFHAEKTPSFGVSGEKQVWYCFGCSQGGDLFDFVQKMEGTDFPQTLEMLAARAGPAPLPVMRRIGRPKCCCSSRPRRGPCTR